MGRLGQIAGLLLLIVGVGLGLWGAPYYMLDWGGTFVMAGIALASAGLSCVLLGTVLIKLAVMRAEITALRAGAAVIRHEAEIATSIPERVETAGPAAAIGDDRPDRAVIQPGPEQPPGLQSGGLAGVAVASAAAGGLAVAAKSILTSVTPEPDLETAAIVADAPAEVPAETSPLASVGLTDSDRASLDDLLARLALPVTSDAALPATSAATMNADDLFARINEASDVLKMEAASEPPQIVAQAAAASVSDAEDSFNPIEPRTMEQRIDDDFADLRAELAVLSRVYTDEAPTGPAESNAQQSLHTESTDQDQQTTKRPDLLAGAVSAGDSPDADDAADDRAADAETADVEHNSEATDLAVAEQVEQTAAPQAGGELEPASSNEGVVAAYNVGDTSYAMFVDGRIRVSTPDGQFMLESMDELKRFMAARRAPM